MVARWAPGRVGVAVWETLAMWDFIVCYVLLLMVVLATILKQFAAVANMVGEF